MSTDALPAGLQPGMIVVTEGGNGPISRGIKWATRSRWTHTFMVVSPDTGIEAWFPDGVRLVDLHERFDELAREHRDFVVLDHPDMDEAARHQIILSAMGFLGRKYDILQIVYFALFRRFIDDGPLRVICSRLETAIYKQDLGWDLFTPESFHSHGTRVSRQWQLAQGWATPGEILSDSVMIPVRSGDADDLREAVAQYADDEPYDADDVDLYARVTAEYEALRGEEAAPSPDTPGAGSSDLK